MYLLNSLHKSPWLHFDYWSFWIYLCHLWISCISAIFFSALTLLVGHHEENPACQNWVILCCCGYLSGARCRLFAYGPADATAIPKHHHLLSHKSRLVFFTFLVPAFLGCPKKAFKQVYSSSIVVADVGNFSDINILLLWTKVFVYDLSVLNYAVLWHCWLGGRKGIRPLKTEWWGAGVVICPELGADFWYRLTQVVLEKRPLNGSSSRCRLAYGPVMPLPLTVSCFSKIQIGLPLWYQLTRVVSDRGPLHGCVCVCKYTILYIGC